MQNTQTLDSILKSLPTTVTVNQELLKKVVATNPNKPKVISSVTEEEQEVFRFFSVYSPCWFTGCEELRKEYKDALDALPSDCPACQKGHVIKQFVPKIKEQLRKHYEQTNNRQTRECCNNPGCQSAATTGDQSKTCTSNSTSN